MSPLRVAMVSEHASPLATLGGVDAGGQNVHVAALALELGRRGVAVVVHTRRDDVRLPRRVAMAPNVTVEHVDAGPPAPVPKDELFGVMDDFAGQLRRAWRRDPPDVVHSHFWMSGHAALAAAGPLGLPLVHTYHALGVVKRRHQGTKDTSPACRNQVELDVLRQADRIIATCSDEVFELLQLGGDPRRIGVVPCGVDLAVFRPDGEREARSGDRRRIASIGRLVERKGIGNVVTALAEVPDAELVIAGGPDRRELDGDPDVRRLRRVVARAGVADRVDFRGRLARHEVAPLLRSADVVACVPWYEPFGIVPLEAMACGVPVVASAVGGLIDTVVDGVTGRHVPARDPGAVAAALRDLMADDARRQALGQAGARRARARYSWPRVASGTLDAYAAVLAPVRVPVRGALS